MRENTMLLDAKNSLASAHSGQRLRESLFTLAKQAICEMLLF